jgi:hypothetical protein
MVRKALAKPNEVRCTGVEDAGCGEEKMKCKKKLKYCM